MGDDRHADRPRASQREGLEAELGRQSLELARQLESHRRLLEINERLLSTLEPDSVFDAIAEGLKQVVAYDNLGVYHVDHEARELRPVLARDRHADEVMRYTIPFGPGLMNWAVAHREPLLVNDALSDPRAIQIPDTPADPEAIIVVPLVVKGEVLGALNIGRVGGEEVHFTDSDFALVQLFAGQAAIAFANTRLYEELQASERRYRDLVDNSPDIVWAVDAEGRLTFLSDTLAPRTGWQPEALIGRHFSAVVEGESRDITEAALARVRQDPRRQQRVRIEVARGNGDVTPVELTMIGRTVDGRFAGAHGSVRDISERERLEASLRQQAAGLAASEERTRLAHELHDSVTQALFSMGLTMRSLELLLETDVTAARDKLAELRELQRDALTEMRSLIFELRPASIEQEGICQALRTHAAAVQSRTGISVTVQAELADEPAIEVEHAVFRVAQEALHNVVKHAMAGSVAVELWQEDGSLRLRVRDDGIGFDPDRVPSGGHLGLLGMRQRAERIGGRLAVESAPGQGSSVTLVAPLRTPDPAT
jgi:PAS domain S-box-containing protein